MKTNKPHDKSNGNKTEPNLPGLNFVEGGGENKGEEKPIETAVSESNTNLPIIEENKKKSPVKEELFAKAEKMDEAQIRETLSKGMPAKEEFYYNEVFDEESNTYYLVYDIAWPGVMNGVKDQGNLESQGYQLVPDPDNWVSAIQCKDVTLGVIITAMGTQPKYMDTEQGMKKDPYGMQISLSKAQRNGFKLLLRKDIIEARFRRWYEDKFGKAPDMSNIVVAGEYESIKKKKD